jgi:microcystin-dependent protein
MARNGSGTYTKVNTFVAGNSITAAGHNQNWDDIATEITNSVAADGQTTLTGPLKAASGSVGAPGVTFASDTDCGLYRIGGNNIGVSVNGAKVLDVATTGLAVTGTLAATGVISQAGFALLPAGVIFPYGGTSAPSGYLLCYGQSLVRADYADLFTAIGTTYGAADGTHFNLPDLRGRVPAGKDDMGGSSANRLTNADDGLNGDTLGATGGGETQTLVTGNLPAYTPAGAITGSATGSVNIPYNGGIGFTAGGGVVAYQRSNPNANDAASVSINISSVGFTGIAQGGTSTAFGVVQPTIILNYIIFAGV